MKNKDNKTRVPKNGLFKVEAESVCTKPEYIFVDFSRIDTVEQMYYDSATDKDGEIRRRMEDAVEIAEDITSDKIIPGVVKSGRHSKSDRVHLEGSTSAMSDDIEGRMLRALSQLNSANLELALSFVVQEAIRSIQDISLESLALAGEQHQ